MQALALLDLHSSPSPTGYFLQEGEPAKPGDHTPQIQY